MSRTREVACINYEAEGKCKCGRAGTFYRQCQICDLYNPNRNGIPARTNTKRQRLERANRKESAAGGVVYLD